jgi:hypothetical protein
MDGFEDLRVVRGPTHHLDRITWRGVWRIGQPKRRDRRNAVCRVSLASGVNRAATGGITQRHLTDGRGPMTERLQGLYKARIEADVAGQARP